MGLVPVPRRRRLVSEKVSRQATHHPIKRVAYRMERHRTQQLADRAIPTFGASLYAKRRMLDPTQTELAEHSDLSNTYICKLQANSAGRWG